MAATKGFAVTSPLGNNVMLTQYQHSHTSLNLLEDNLGFGLVRTYYVNYGNQCDSFMCESCSIFSTVIQYDHLELIKSKCFL